MKNRIFLGSILVTFLSLSFYLTGTARLENASLKIYGSKDAHVTTKSSLDHKSAANLTPDALKKTKNSNSALAKVIIKNVDDATAPIEVATENLKQDTQYANIKNTDQAQDVSSVLKLFILIAYEKEGKVSQTFKVTSDEITENDRSLQAGTAYSGAFLKDLMIRQNNNTAANILLKSLGAKKVNQVAHSVGATHTKITGKFGDEKVGVTTAADLELVMKKLYQGKIKDTNSDNQILGQLLNFPDKGLASQVSGTVYKISDDHASVALVQSSRGQVYVMSGISENNSFNFEKLGSAINTWYEKN
ncbi:serine hydrolase [Lactobacillus sp. PV034]|uniref:serine hydrolase n=1 Tax=Lactobacillus sp. PV034 TaxID=2594495 RepID=UPI0022404FC8|nr:serine hydrolase [Lactobacillus sp. PV034]QNQ81316.1 serine hydrolase [Lactobacillus sp. PV034]